MPVATEEYNENPQYGQPSLGWDSNPETVEYEGDAKKFIASFGEVGVI